MVMGKNIKISLIMTCAVDFLAPAGVAVNHITAPVDRYVMYIHTFNTEENSTIL